MAYFPNQGQQTSSKSQSIVPASDAPQFVTGNITTEFRDDMTTYTPGETFTETAVGSGDIISLEGNALGASYLVVSKSPWNQNTETILDSVFSFQMPVDLSVGIHRSQAALGQEISVEVVSDEYPISEGSDVAITSMSQTTTTLTVDTATAHGLNAGATISIYGCNDSRFNYFSVVVASAPTTTQFTVTAGPGGTIASLTAAPSSLGSPFVSVRSRMKGAKNGSSMIFENATTTNASFYMARKNGQLMVLSGTLNGSHVATVTTSASTAYASAARAYAFGPGAEYRCNIASDRLQWLDGSIDSQGGFTSRAIRTVGIPDPSKTYKVRLRARNNKGLTVPIGKIVSATKSGTTTATVTFASAHGLTTGDYLNIYGARDTTNFPNLTTATVVSSVVNSTQITIIWGGAVTATTYGGYASRVNGSITQQGAVTQVGQSVSVASSIVTLVGSASWSGASIGDFVEVIGVRNATNGNDLGVDGSYRVVNISTTSLVLEALSGTTPPSTLVSTNCGGGIIKRTDMRLSFIRFYEYIRERIDVLPRANGELSYAMPVIVTSSTTVGVNVTPSTTVGAGTSHHLISAAGTNATSVKTSAGTINTISLSNNANAVRYLKLYNKASAPVVGTDTPVATILLPVGGSRDISGGPFGIRLATGIAYAITTGIAISDTGGIGADEVSVFIQYT